MRHHILHQLFFFAVALVFACWAPQARADSGEDAEAADSKSSSPRDSGVSLHAALSSAAVARGAAQDTGAAGGHVEFGFWSVPSGDESADAKTKTWPFSADGWRIRGRAHTNAHVLSCIGCEGALAPPSSFEAIEQVAFRTGYLNLSQWAGYQRSGQFEDAYWRPARSQTQAGMGVEMPGVARFSGKADLVAAELMFNAISEPGIRFGERFDTGIHARVFDVVDRHRHSSFRGQILGIDARRFAAPSVLDSEEAESAPTDTRLYIIDLRGITFDQGRHTFGFAWGKRTLAPAQARAPDGADAGQETSAATDLQFHFTRHGAGRHRFRDGGRPNPFIRDVRYHVGTGSFARIGPTGFGVDRGWKLEIDGAIPLARRWALRGEAVGVTARRKHVARAPSTVTVLPEGTRLLMGRAELGASHWFGDRMALELSVWGERSDRYASGATALIDDGFSGITSRVGASAALSAKIF